MTPRAWLSALILAMLFGVLIGWTVRVLTLHDQYLTSQLWLMDTKAKYFNTKTDQLIRDNERTLKHDAKQSAP